MLAAGQVIDRYEVVHLLGEGGMAVVYLVRHRTLHSLHALKVLTVSSPAIHSRLIAEGRAQASLQHPHAIPVTDVVDVDGAPGLVMEYVEGGTLGDWVEQESPSRESRLELFMQVCAAVAEAHRRGWVHRDLKPENVLVKRTAEGPLAKVSDFGLVKAVVGGSLRDGQRTRGGLPMGSPGFIAPEQIEDAAGVDARADVFSLGCILVWLLSGRSPYEADSVVGSFARVAAGDHDRLPAGDPLAGVVERALSVDPAARHPDAASLLDAVRDPPSVLPPALPRRRASPWLLPAVLLSGVAVFLVPLVLVLCLGAGMTVRTDGVRLQDSGACDLGSPELVGHIYTRAKKVRKGSRRTLSRTSEVFRTPGDELPVCSLPKGTVVTARESTRFNLKGVWFKVYGDAVELP